MSHGWSNLAPVVADESVPSFDFVLNASGGAVDVSVRESDKGLEVGIPDGDEVADETASAVRRMLRLEEDLRPFHDAVRRRKELRWIAETGAGRLMRSPSVFEDIVKTICTTNCTWAQTRAMVSRLVETLGEASPSGKKSFPSPEAIASADEEFLRDQIKAGYRGDYIREFARSVAAGELDPEAWAESELPTDDLKRELMAIKGVGKYSAEHMLKLLGRYDSLALDSFLRSEFYKRHNAGGKCADRVIEDHYEAFGEWRGLVIWFDMCGP